MKEVAEACGVSDYTLREWKRRLCEHPCSPSIRKTAAEEAISERTITKRCCKKIQSLEAVGTSGIKRWLNEIFRLYASCIK